MRDLGKYRGLRKDGKGWVDGSLIVNYQRYYIMEDDANMQLLRTSHLSSELNWQIDKDNIIEVIPETVGELTGLVTKTNVPLDWWEGDILKSPDGERAIIVFNTLGAGFYIKRPQDNYFLLPIYKAWKQGWSRIGNIHEEKP